MEKRFDDTINDNDLEGIDDIIDNSNGVIDIDNSNVNNPDVKDEYVPVSTKPNSEKITEADLESAIDIELAYMASRNDELFESTKSTILDEMTTFSKNLIKNQGFTPDEAMSAAIKRASKRAKEENDRFKFDNPETVEIRVNKTDADKLVIDPEDESKVHKSAAIKLIEVEDKELKHLKIRRRDSKSNISIMQMNTCALNRYTVPCINTVDMCTFAGTSSYNLVQNVFSDNDTPYDRYAKQIAFVYDRFISSATKNKYGALGNTVMTLEDFSNWFLFPDLQAALYAIYVASSTEMLTSKIKCLDPDCKDIDEKETDPNKRTIAHTYDYTYNCKELMDFSEMPEEFKMIKTQIERYAGRYDDMKQLQENQQSAHRYKSSMTLNVYDIQVPSCARALEFQKFIKEDDEDHMSESWANVAMYIHAAYIYTGENDEDGNPIYYEPITDAEELYHLVENVVEPEFQLFYKKFIPKRAFIYSFKLKTKCDKCGRSNDAVVDVPTLVFLKARGTEAVIE